MARFDQLTLAPSADLHGRSRIHRHDFSAEVVRYGLTAGTTADEVRPLIANAKACLIADAPFALTRDVAAECRRMGNYVAVLPAQGGGVGLIEADLLFAGVAQARRWLFASPRSGPAELLVGLSRECPRAKAVVLVETATKAHVRVGGDKAKIEVGLAVVPFSPPMLHLAEVSCHLLGQSSEAPTLARLGSILEFALEAASSPGGHANFPALRGRYAVARAEAGRAAVAA